ncbi:MAG: AAA family ATPase [Bacillota bacterium]
MKHITIGRQYGSGGRNIGKKVAEKLGMPVYDRELIMLASQKSGVSAKYIESLDEKGTANFFHSLVINAAPTGAIMPNYFNITTNDQLFILQSEIIKELAKKTGSIFIGRCADYVLEDENILSIFIHAPYNFRLKNIAQRDAKSYKQAEDKLNKIDKKRKSYYNHYTNKKWGDVENYHLAIDSSKISEEKIVEIIIEAYKD